MSSKPKKRSGGDEDVKRDKPLQAVLLADSFTNSFRPISLELPKVLCPLGNAPMLSYALESLAANDVKEVFVFCIAHADLISNFIDKSGTWLNALEANSNSNSNSIIPCVN